MRAPLVILVWLQDGERGRERDGGLVKRSWVKTVKIRTKWVSRYLLGGCVAGRGEAGVAGSGRGGIWLQESAVYSVRVVVVSDTRHVAYYHRYAVRTEAVQLIQLWYTAIRGLTTPCLPSVITTMVGYHGSGSWIRQTPPLCLHFETPSHETFRCCLPLRRSFNNGLSKCIAVWRKETRPLLDDPPGLARKFVNSHKFEALDRRGGEIEFFYLCCIHIYIYTSVGYYGWWNG